ncbi:MAG: DoxX family protein [Beijerinckiaceae bacterium]|nr:DoxX family protein [Beijerinckiaceae bacterium]
MSDSITNKPKLLFPGLRGFYDTMEPVSWLVIRVAVGFNLMIHGWGKVVKGPSAYIKGFTAQGFEPALPWIWAAIGIEFVGGIALIIGLFTRFFAATAAVQLFIIMCLYWKNGFGWVGHGYEYVLLWGLICFAISLRGGGPYSADNAIGKEL